MPEERCEVDKEIDLNDVIELNAINTIARLLEEGADINDVDDFGRTALHKAAHGGYVKLTGFLLKHGADREIKDKSGYTALYYALAAGSNETALLLQNNKY
jgi:ankyrin repeat protein